MYITLTCPSDPPASLSWCRGRERSSSPILLCNTMLVITIGTRMKMSMLRTMQMTMFKTVFMRMFLTMMFMRMFMTVLMIIFMRMFRTTTDPGKPSVPPYKPDPRPHWTQILPATISMFIKFVMKYQHRDFASYHD